MKTIPEIKKEIVEINARIVTEHLGVRDTKRLTEQIIILRLCVWYLETCPTEQYLREALAKVETEVSEKMSLFKLPPNIEKLPKGIAGKLRTAFEQKKGIPKLRDQVRTLRYLLD